MAEVRWKGAAATVACFLVGLPLGKFLGGPDHGGHALGFTLANIALGIPIALAVTALAEVLVAAIARLLGDRIAFMSIGFGPFVLKKQVGSAVLAIALVPTHGDTWITTTRRDGQLRRIMIARVGAGLLIATLAIAVLASGKSGLARLSHQITGLPLLNISSILVAAFSIFRIPTSERLRDLYGYGVTFAWHARYAQGAFEEAERIAMEGLRVLPEHPQLLLARAGARQRADGEALEIAAKLRQSDAVDIRILANNLWAWQAYLHGTDALRAEAERAVEEALALAKMPTPSLEASLRDTRGHVALWNKRYADAERDLVWSYGAGGRSAYGRMTSAAGMAMVCAATNRPDEARDWLAKARAEGFEHDLVARATAAVEPLNRS